MFGVDFEDSYEGNHIDDIAWICCSLLDTKPGLFEKSYPKSKIDIVMTTISWNLQIREVSVGSKRFWGPIIVKLTTLGLESPLFYFTEGDYFTGKRWFKFMKTTPEDWEKSQIITEKNVLSHLETDLREEIFRIETYHHDIFEDLDFTGKSEGPSLFEQEWIHSRILTFEEYKYFHSIVFLENRV